jgi:hypothetical protein
MPLSIPYNPSLALGNIVDPDALATLLQISACQALIEGAHDKLRSFISMKRSIDMTIQELTNMDIDATGLIKSSETIGRSIVAAATEYATIRLEQETKIQELKTGVQMVNTNLESPIDYDRSRIREMPLSADSLTMDVQYFSFDETRASAGSTIATIKDFIDASTNVLGDAMSGRISAAATSQIHQQQENHDIAGTLIISASCTHRNALVLSPCVLDVDKAVAVWNGLFSGESDRLSVSTPAAVRKMTQEKNGNGQSIGLLSGATFGSSFVGMVHVLRKEATKPLSPALIDSIQEQFTIGKWFAKESGGFGIDPAFSTTIRNLISSQNISSHVTIITMGVVPSLKSNEVRTGVRTMADADAGKLVENISVVTNDTDEIITPPSSAARSQNLAEMMAVRASTTENVMIGLSKIDEAANKILDVNSMMTAFEDYISKVNSGKSGVPVNYFVKPITRSQLAELWMAKYYPARNRPAPDDDAAAKASSEPPQN